MSARAGGGDPKGDPIPYLLIQRSSWKLARARAACL